MSVTLYLAIPCYNEETVLPETARRLREKFTALRAAGTIGPMSRICFIDDGSKDATWQLISDLHARDPAFSGSRLSRNRGHQNALLCGLMTLRNRADCVISMDADLQDDIDAIDAMLTAFQNGNDIVYGVRASRKQDSAFKRATAQGYYRLLRALGADVVYSHADYRLMSRRALDALAEYKEVNLFLRGLVPLVGYPSTVVYYERGKRFAGESKYPLRKMLSFAWEGVSSLTVSPLRLITRIGIVMFLVSIAMLAISPATPLPGGRVSPCPSGPSAGCSCWPSAWWGSTSARSISRRRRARATASRRSLMTGRRSFEAPAHAL